VLFGIIKYIYQQDRVCDIDDVNLANKMEQFGYCHARHFTSQVDIFNSTYTAM